MESVEAQLTASSFLRSKCQHVLEAPALLLGLGDVITAESLCSDIEAVYFRGGEAAPETSLEVKSGTTKLLLYLSLEQCGRGSAGGAR